MNDLRDLIEQARGLLGERSSSPVDQPLAEGSLAWDDPSFTSPYPHVPETPPQNLEQVYTGTQSLGGPADPQRRAGEGDDLPTQPYTQGSTAVANANLSNAVMYLRQAYEFLQTASRHANTGSQAQTSLAQLYSRTHQIHNEALNLAKEVNGG